MWKYCVALLYVSLFFALVSPAAAEPIEPSLNSQLVRFAPRLSPEVAQLALRAAFCAAGRSEVRIDRLAIIDYSLPSSEKRFWLFDLQHPKLLVEDFVAHGKNTGENIANNFSNTPGSLQSSLGLFRAGSRYIGKHGNSLRLIGLEPGFNDTAYDRALVIHGADYVSPSFIRKHQRLGRSFGCPALAPSSARTVIDQFSESNGFLFAYYPDKKWLRLSSYLNACTGL